MADDQDENQEQAAAPPPKSRKKLYLVIGGVIFLLLAIGVPVTVMMLKSTDEEIEALGADAASEGSLAPEGAEDEDELAEGEEALGAIFPLETFVVNLQGGGLIRAQIQLEFSERDVPRRFYTKMVPIRDAIIAILAKRNQEEATSEKGRETLKGDLKDTINEILKKEDVKNVYFTQFVVQ